MLQPTETGGTFRKLGIESTFKYTKDAQFCLGVTKVCIVNAEGEEIKSPPCIQEDGNTPQFRIY